MIKPCTLLLTIALAGTAAAQNSVQISLGVRETDAGGGSFSAIGADGGTSGGIEWVNIDAQTLTLDGSWQQFIFDLANDPITQFAGSTANSVLDGTFGTIEHVRILNNNGITTPLQIWIDDVANTITPSGGNPTTTTFGDFEGFGQGDEVMFQEPSFSGSTASNIAANPTPTAGVDNFVASRSASDRFEFAFVDNTTTRWVRMTTFAASNQPNPSIRFDQSSVVSFWMRGGECQPNLGGDNGTGLIAELCGEGMTAGLQNNYVVAGATPQAPGALFLSLTGGNDLPFQGGTMISFTNLIADVPLMADANGMVTVPVSGASRQIDFVLQPLFLEPQSNTVQVGNAVQAEFGR